MTTKLNILLILSIPIITNFACKKDPASSNDDLSITDIDGNTYTSVIISNQEWMAENLKVTHYRNGDAIPEVTDNSQWTNLSNGAYCVHNYFDDIETYGLLYNWYAVNDSRNIAPTGWHVPTDEELKQLEIYLGMSQAEADNFGWRGTDAGGKLKEEGTTHWMEPNTGATNEAGFSVLPGGYRSYDNGTFANIGYKAYFWSSTEADSNVWGSEIGVWSRILSYSQSAIYRNEYSKQDGFSVRCVKD